MPWPVNLRGKARRSAFNPASLFAAGEKGLWYDPSDMSTMFQDSAGTTPVTAVGQSVGKMLDKSGNGQHWTQATGSQRPILRQTGNAYWLELTVVASSALATTISGWPSDLASCVGHKSTIGTNNHVLASVGPAGIFYGARVSASSSSSWEHIATPLVTMVNGTAVYPNTQGGLYAATGASLVIEEDLGLNISNWTAYQIGAYGGGTSFGGGIYGVLVYQATTSARVASVRAYMEGKTGAVAGAYSGGFGYVLGDSTIAAYLAQNSVASYITTATSPINSLAVPGDTIAGQRTLWDASRGPAYAKWAIIEVGLNDLDPTEAASIAIARLQALVADVRVGITAGAKVIISQMTPCKQRLIDVYGAGQGAVAYQKWLDINAAIAGSGATPITSVDARVTSHVAALGDGSDNLSATYEIAGTVDHIHENNAGRQIIAAAWTTALSGLGVL